ncbi:MAG TPA: class I SAM-dependent methyltransferase, partial [Gemmatimonadaceae bacterium]
TVMRRGGTGVGLTLSEVQARVCRDAGVDARLLDWKEADTKSIGQFDAVVSIGAMEAFCSVEEHLAGRQEEVYRHLFEFCHRALRPGGWMFLQTMLWDRKVPAPEDFNLKAPRGSDAYILAVLKQFFPGSWPPSGLEQIARAAARCFSVESTNNGRADYIRTMEEWSTRLKRVSFGKIVAVLRMLPHFVTDRDFGLRLEALWHDYNKQAFQRGLMTHERIVLKRLS